MRHDEREAPGTGDVVDHVVDGGHLEVRIQWVLVLGAEREVKLVWSQELHIQASDTTDGSVATSFTHCREGIHRVPVAVPVVHDDRLGRGAGNTEFLRDVYGQVVEAGRGVRGRDVQMLLFARNLDRHRINIFAFSAYACPLTFSM